jgi:hypothetical protein
MELVQLVEKGALKIWPEIFDIIETSWFGR